MSLCHSGWYQILVWPMDYMAFAIAHRVFAVPAQCQAHHGEFHDNV